MKQIFFLGLYFSVMSFFSQNNIPNLDKYQYLIVYDKFDFVNKTDKYQTSSLTKFLFQKKGFKVYLNSDKNQPQELLNKRCLALFVNVKRPSAMFTIKSIIEIKDCFGNIVYTSKVGRSNYKEYKKGYHEAIRSAFNSMEDFKYSYKPDSISTKSKKENGIVIKNMTPIVAKKNSLKVTTPVSIEQREIVNKSIDKMPVLYAQPKTNGYQLINVKPEVVFVLLKTSLKDIYIIKDKNGTLYRNGTNWIAEYYENDKLIQKKYQVKF